MQGGALRLAARNAAVSAATAPPAGRAGVTWRRAGTMRILAPPGGAISAKLGGQRAALPRKQVRGHFSAEKASSGDDMQHGALPLPLSSPLTQFNDASRPVLSRLQSRLRVADEETGSTVETAQGGAGSGSKDVFLDVAKAEEG